MAARTALPCCGEDGAGGDATRRDDDSKRWRWKVADVTGAAEAAKRIPYADRDDSLCLFHRWKIAKTDRRPRKTSNCRMRWRGTSRTRDDDADCVATAAVAAAAVGSDCPWKLVSNYHLSAFDIRSRTSAGEKNEGMINMITTRR